MKKSNKQLRGEEGTSTDDETLARAKGGKHSHCKSSNVIDHFTVVCSVTWPLNDIEAGGDLVLRQTSLLLLCKSSCSNAN